MLSRSPDKAAAIPPRPKITLSSLLNEGRSPPPARCASILERWADRKKGSEGNLRKERPNQQIHYSREPKSIQANAGVCNLGWGLAGLLCAMEQKDKCNDQKALTKICGTPFLILPCHPAFRQSSLLGGLGRMLMGGGINERGKNRVKRYFSHRGGCERRPPTRFRGAYGSCIIWYAMLRQF